MLWDGPNQLNIIRDRGIFVLLPLGPFLQAQVKVRGQCLGQAVFCKATPWKPFPCENTAFLAPIGAGLCVFSFSVFFGPDGLTISRFLLPP